MTQGSSVGQLGVPLHEGRQGDENDGGVLDDRVRRQAEHGLGHGLVSSGAAGVSAAVIPPDPGTGWESRGNPLRNAQPARASSAIRA